MSTQPDKMYEALSTFNNILGEMPKSDVQFLASKESLLKEIEAERHQNGNREFWRYRWLKSLNIDQNNREEIYTHVKTLTIDDMEEFFNKYIKNRTYNCLVVGDKNRIDKQLLAQYGEIVELELEDIYGY
jgi:secreted Zn-dependent insulinase-like peptidase